MRAGKGCNYKWWLFSAPWWLDNELSLECWAAHFNCARPPRHPSNRPGTHCIPNTNHQTRGAAGGATNAFFCIFAPDIFVGESVFMSNTYSMLTVAWKCPRCQFRTEKRDAWDPPLASELGRGTVALCYWVLLLGIASDFHFLFTQVLEYQTTVFVYLGKLSRLRRWYSLWIFSKDNVD